MIGLSQVQPDIFADPGDTTAVVFEAPSRLSKYSGGEIWIGASGSSKDWGSCNVLVSMDGSTYKQIGSIEARARIGTLAATFATGADPDTSHSLVVNLAENTTPLDAGTQADADQGNTLAYVDGEIIAYSACAISGQNQYTMDGYIRRGIRGSFAASHAAGSSFMRLDDAVFRFDYDPSWAGRLVHFKFQSVNTFDNAVQDPSTLDIVEFVIPGQGGNEPPAQTTDIVNPDFEVDADLPPYGWQFTTSIVTPGGGSGSGDPGAAHDDNNKLRYTPPGLNV